MDHEVGECTWITVPQRMRNDARWSSGRKHVTVPLGIGSKLLSILTHCSYCAGLTDHPSLGKESGSSLNLHAPDCEVLDTASGPTLVLTPRRGPPSSQWCGQFPQYLAFLGCKLSDHPYRFRDEPKCPNLILPGNQIDWMQRKIHFIARPCWE